MPILQIVNLNRILYKLYVFCCKSVGLLPNTTLIYQLQFYFYIYLYRSNAFKVKFHQHMQKKEAAIFRVCTEEQRR